MLRRTVGQEGAAGPSGWERGRRGVYGVCTPRWTMNRARPGDRRTPGAASDASASASSFQTIRAGVSARMRQARCAFAVERGLMVADVEGGGGVDALGYVHGRIERCVRRRPGHQQRGSLFTGPAASM